MPGKYVLSISLYLKSSNTLLLVPPKNASTLVYTAALKNQGFDVNEINANVKVPDLDWDLGIWSKVEKLNNIFVNLNAKKQTLILNSQKIEKVFIFREPLERLWSAWASKVFLGEPSHIHIHKALYRDRFVDKNFRRISNFGIANAFEMFLEYLKKVQNLKDAHFTTQKKIIETLPFNVKTVSITNFLNNCKDYKKDLGKIETSEYVGNSKSLVPGPFLTEKSRLMLEDMITEDYSLLDITDKYSSKKYVVNESNYEEFDALRIRDFIRFSRRLSHWVSA